MTPLEAVERLLILLQDNTSPDAENAHDLSMLVSRADLDGETRARLYTWLADQLSG